ncbi:uncharacterized protein LOC125376220 [Haliotis rufescens]|uniref:uncharacterized protein LOC125376220 n=1 Tax=Haliotis rufescens TaxID=6454 RepID=UPI00201EB1D4|nr:uncharacterized protein LOC125376220 [Haliotis rufescens]
MEGKRKRSDEDEDEKSVQKQARSRQDITGMTGGKAKNCIVIGQNNQTCHHFQDLISETELKIRSMDDSKHVSTHAEDAAYKHLTEQGCVVIRGRSGSGKSHMGYTLLQRASKEFSRKPVKISSPDEWNYLPKSSLDSIHISEYFADKFIVMIDDIFGSTNLIQHNLDQWRQKFDLVWPQVESGQIWLVMTSRSEIITQTESTLHRYDIFTSSRSIKLDEKLHGLTEEEKIEFLDTLCGNHITYVEKTLIAMTDTALGFPQCCKYFASHKHIKESGYNFFRKPFEIIKEEIKSLKRSQRDSYCMLLMVVAYDGQLPKRLVKTISPPEEFTSRCKQMMKASGLKEEPNMKEILQALCCVYLVSDGNCYQFSHRSIHDVLFVDLCESFPDLGIDMCTPSMLVEYIWTLTDIKCDMRNVFVLEKDYYPTLAKKLREYLTNKDSRYIVLSHPSLNDGNIFREIFGGCDIKMMSLQRKENKWIVETDYDVRYRFCKVCSNNDQEIGKCAGITYGYFLSHTIMNGMVMFAEYIIHQVSSATDAETQSMLNEALVCSVYVGQNHLVDVLLRMGVLPSWKCLHVLSTSPGLNPQTSLKLIKIIKLKPDSLKQLFHTSVKHYNVTFLESIIEMCTENMYNHKNVYRKAIEGLITELNTSARYRDILSTLSRAVEVMSLLHKAGGIMDLDEILTLASCKNAPDTLIEFIYVVFQIPPSNCDEMKSSLCHGKKFHQLLRSLIDREAPVQMKDETVKTLLHKAASNQCKQCVNMLLSDVEGTDSDGNTALHCLIKSDENHNHEVLEILIEKTNYRQCNKCDELPLHPDEPYQKHFYQETCQRFFDKKASIHIKNNLGKTVLHLAAEAKCKKCLEMLLPMLDINDQDKAGNTTLHCLTHFKRYGDFVKSKCSDHETYQLLLDKGPDVHIKNKAGQTVLHLAAWANCKKCVEMLLPMSDINDQDEKGNTALHHLTHHFAFYRYYYGKRSRCLDHETYQLFLDKGADVQIKNNEGQTVLQLAARANCKKCVEMLLLMFDINDQDEAGNTALHYLHHQGLHFKRISGGDCHKTFQLLLDKGADVQIKNKEGKTVLHGAAETHCHKCVEMLLPMFDINLQDEGGNTVLHNLHCQKSYFFERSECVCHKTCQLFLDKGADVKIKNKKGQTVLHLAAETLCNKCVKILLPMFDINDRDEAGNTALHYLTHCEIPFNERSNFVCFETYQLFLDKGADVKIKNKEGQTVLHLAAEANCKHIVEMLLPMFDINDQDEAGNTALHYLHCQDSHFNRRECLHCEIYLLFLDKGADVKIKNKEGQTVLHLAAEANCKRSLEMLLPMFDINVQDDMGKTALHYLTHNDSNVEESVFDRKSKCLDHETYQLFLDKGADVQIKNKEGQTVLHLAAKANCNKCVEMLLPMFDINDQDEAGNTALHYLHCQESYFYGVSKSVCHKTYQFFLDKGADVKIKNKEGQTVLHLAAKANCKHIVEMLLPMFDINDQDEAGNTALHYLHRQDSHFHRRECLHREIYLLFLDKGADVKIKNKEGQTVLHLTAEANCKRSLEILLPMFDINVQDDVGKTALHYLTHNDSNVEESVFDRRSKCLDHETYQLFLDKGADVQIKNKEGQTVLHLAAKANCKKCVEMLLPMSDINDQAFS